MKGTLKAVRDRCTDDGDCWIWTQGVHPKSLQPQATIDGKGGQLVRRWIYAQHHRVNAQTRVVTTCGHRLCLNPMHLKAMTFSEVLQRSYSQGARSTQAEYVARFKAAEAAGMVKLTREQVNEIRQRIRNGETIVALSREFDVYETTLRKIKYGRSWREEAPNASVFSWRPA